jgi:1-acyl-sn-glycerol-3-phosphate acyltransferase
MAFLINAWVWTVVVLIVLFGFPIMVVIFALTAPFDPGRYVAGRFFRLMAVAAVKINPLWSFRTDGRMISDPRRPYVAVSNHISYADIFLISHLPWEMKWLAKDTVFKIPVMGWIMHMAGDIHVVRGNRESIVSAIKGCRDRLAKRVSVMIFPEGTRSKTGELQAFKDGAFRIAIESQAPILPIAVAGTRDGMAKGTFQFRRATARCHVLDPIETAGLSLKDVPQLRERVRELIDDARRGLQAELGVAPARAAQMA